MHDFTSHEPPLVLGRRGACVYSHEHGVRLCWLEGCVPLMDPLVRLASRLVQNFAEAVIDVDDWHLELLLLEGARRCRLGRLHRGSARRGKHLQQVADVSAPLDRQPVVALHMDPTERLVRALPACAARGQFHFLVLAIVDELLARAGVVQLDLHVRGDALELGVAQAGSGHWGALRRACLMQGDVAPARSLLDLGGRSVRGGRGATLCSVCSARFDGLGLLLRLAILLSRLLLQTRRARRRRCAVRVLHHLLGVLVVGRLRRDQRAERGDALVRDLRLRLRGPALRGPQLARRHGDLVLRLALVGQLAQLLVVDAVREVAAQLVAAPRVVDPVVGGFELLLLRRELDA